MLLSEKLYEFIISHIAFNAGSPELEDGLKGLLFDRSQ
jgi:hypothetical protein